MIFIKQFFKSAKYTGAVAPSSSFLAKKMVAKAELEKAEIIIELGPGSGAITKEILKKMPKQSRLLTFEINKEFHLFLEKKYPQATHISADILHLAEELEKQGIASVDAIISGIPFVDFSKKDCHQMLDQIKSVMHTDSRLILFTYSSLKFKTFFSYFEKEDICYVPLNVPPAYVLTLKKKAT